MNDDTPMIIMFFSVFFFTFFLTGGEEACNEK